MDDLISRQAAIDALTEYGNGRAVYISVEEAVRRIEQLPSAQPEQCEWIPKEVERVPYGLIVECSKCGRSELVDNALYHKYCPNCGRKVITE